MPRIATLIDLNSTVVTTEGSPQTAQSSNLPYLNSTVVTTEVPCFV